MIRSPFDVDVARLRREELRSAVDPRRPAPMRAAAVDAASHRLRTSLPAPAAGPAAATRSRGNVGGRGPLQGHSAGDVGRRFERAVLGGAMELMAIALERRIVGGSRARGITRAAPEGRA